MKTADYSRPESLFPLYSSVTALTGVGHKIGASYKRLGLCKVRDLIFFLPTSGKRREKVTFIKDTKLPAFITIKVKVESHFQASRKSPIKVLVTDSSIDFEIIFFNVRLQWVKEVLPAQENRIISGKVDFFSNRYQIINPDFIVRENELELIPSFEAIYPLSKGLSQKRLAVNIQESLKKVPYFEEWIEADLIKKMKWPKFNHAINSVHSPSATSDLDPHTIARQRLAYDELFAHQVSLALARRMFKGEKGISIVGGDKILANWIKTLPFSLTSSQELVMKEIFNDLESSVRMNRLLQGDVGSGKTIVALLCILKVVQFGGQVALLAPTDILAKQHENTISKLMSDLNLNVTLLTGRDGKKARETKLREIKLGGAHVIIGTHALFQEKVTYKDLRLAIIDEQHRFGVKQRLELAQKGYSVDMLVMTATPIPRSLALACYGDMDFSLLDEKPAHRQPVQTAVKPVSKIESVLDRLKLSLDAGKRVYWVCPLVEDSEKVSITSAQNRFEILKQRFPKSSIGIVHGKMIAEQKDKIMTKFSSGKINILVSTTVIEVGVDVPEASIMIIESAERFGLAQLHQLRGRVGRGNEKSSCILLYSGSLGKNSKARLNILRETEDGFRISEEDLKIRGAGDLLGVVQSGLPEFAVARLEHHTSLMNIARENSRSILRSDPDLVTKRGYAIRNLLHLMNLGESLHYITAG